ncbi:MAG TPA: DUF2306 domain-containing protein [Steroidobacteraceae bacterium]|nr:DUF2306 domain-containing protein [Steroidobacteraceae bacterium]
MAATGIHLPPRSRPWGLIVLLAVLAAAGLWFVGHNVLHYVQFNEQTYGPFWPRRFGLALHIVGGLTALSVGIVQIWLGLTGRTRGQHPVLGRVYVCGILLGSAGGFYLALTISSQFSSYAAGLFMLCVAWLVTTGTAIVAVRRHDYEQHREWMIRSYTVTFAFVTFRLFADWLVALHVPSRVEISTTMAWACWAVPLLIAEPLLQLRRMRMRRP